MYYKISVKKNTIGEPIVELKTLGSFRSASGKLTDSSIFTLGQTLKQSNLLQVKSSMKCLGKIPDVVFGERDIPIVKGDFAAELAEMFSGEIQIAHCSMTHTGDEYAIINVCHKFEVLDMKKSEISYWLSDPSKKDKIFLVTKIVLSLPSDFNANIFRMSEWPIAIIVSDKFKTAYEHSGRNGIDFEPLECSIFER